ncbi:glycosyltransferase family 4 protein [Candidatus Daviesbacteria bacterium]|nr:glycosyltransferase family 4 protein [Candidatus Daviesbacteria bacterium]
MILKKDKTKILMLTHYTNRSEYGEDTDMRILRYLKDKVQKIILITHPLPEFGHHTSYCLIYINGQKVRELKASVYNGPEFLKYLHHIIITYYFLSKTDFSFHLCIAMENLSFITILPLRFLSLMKRLVYYSLDFVPQRFNNSFLNSLYRFMDKTACRFSDTNWVMVKEQIKERKQYGITRLNSAPFNIVPICYNNKRINVLPFDKINFYNILYMGAIRESTGPQLTIQAMPYLIKKFPKIRLTIIGSGKYLDYLKDLVFKLKLNRYVDFTGYIEKFADMTDLMVQKSIGLAPYIPKPNSLSYYSDPSKIKLYMCCGLPVITTDVATMSNLISKTKSGVVINYSEKSLADAVAKLLSSEDKYKSYKDAAIKLSKKFDINNILRSAIAKISN